MKEKGKKKEEEEKRILSGHDAFVQHATPTLGCRARPTLWVHLNTQRNYANNTPSIFEFGSIMNTRKKIISCRYFWSIHQQSPAKLARV